MNIPEIEISVKFKNRKVEGDGRRTVRTSKDVADVLREIFDADTFEWTESFMILCLNQSNRITGFKKISSGGITGTVADPRVILLTALNCLATSIVLCHNHPSGNLKPSRTDEELTQKIKMAASYLDIKVLDHIILSEEGYYSFADEGLL